MAVPTSVAPEKNSTFAIVPMFAVALAWSAIVAGVVNVAPVTGVLSDTVTGGSTFTAPLVARRV